MVDHMLCRNGIGDEKSAAGFITKYNTQVFYDQALCLKDYAAKRQARPASRTIVRDWSRSGQDLVAAE
jgi:hypothetical protein